jgi:hypothetical protein
LHGAVFGVLLSPLAFLLLRSETVSPARDKLACGHHPAADPWDLTLPPSKAESRWSLWLDPQGVGTLDVGDRVLQQSALPTAQGEAMGTVAWPWT